MKIGFDAHYLGQRQTGNETYTRELLRSLAAYESQFEIVAAISANTQEGLGLELPNYRFVSTNAVRRVLLDFPRRFRDVDLLHLQYSVPPTRIPTVVTIHDVGFMRLKNIFPTLTQARMRYTIRQAAQRSQAIITVSEFSKQEICEVFHVPPEKVFVTPLAANSEFITGPSDLALLDSYGLKNKEYFMSVGSLQPRKNLRLLLQAFRVYLDSQRVSSHKLLLTGGKENDIQQIAMLVHDYGLEQNVVQTGYLPINRLAKLYRSAIAFCYLSMYEGFGLPVLEAMASGCPVIASNLSSIPEVAGKSAVLINPFDVEEVVQSLRLVSDDAKRRKLVAAGLLRAKEFSWSRTAQTTALVWNEFR